MLSAKFAGGGVPAAVKRRAVKSSTELKHSLYTHTYIHTYINTHIHKHIHTYTHTYVQIHTAYAHTHNTHVNANINKDMSAKEHKLQICEENERERKTERENAYTRT
jgi:hypothetical protein